MFLEISQNLQESTCARVSFLIKLQTSCLLQNTYGRLLLKISHEWLTKLRICVSVCGFQLPMRRPLLLLFYAEAALQRCSYKNDALKICSKSTALNFLFLYHTSAWVFFCKFAAYLQNTFSYEYLWRTAPVNISLVFFL